MKHIIRLEIVVNKPNASQVIAALEKAGVMAYTMLEGASGRGDRGLRAGGELSDAASNNYIISTCDPEQLDSVTSRLRPLLRRVGGMCLATPSQWLEHEGDPAS